MHKPAVFLAQLLSAATTMDEVVRFIEETCSREQQIPKYLVTINTNYLALSFRDPLFREAVLAADLRCLDGMIVFWLSRFLGLARGEKVSGSDLLPELSKRKLSANYKVFIFGTAEDLAKEACRRINVSSSSLKAVGYISPLFGNVEELSRQEYIDTVNASGADILFLSLRADKAIKWIALNRQKLKVKFIAHVGAAIDFLGGKVKRAPLWIQKAGFEWLWRIAQEPRLYRRYLNDGITLIYIFFRYMLSYKIFLRRKNI